jgi:uncharacterized protein YjbI with pentapeptide repeats
VQAAVNVLARRWATEIPKRYEDSPVDLHGTDLRNLWMSGGHFEQGFFAECVFLGSDLSWAYLSEGLFLKADLRGAKLDQAHIEEANFTDALYDPGQFDMCIWDSKTIFPEGYVPPEKST